MSEDSSPLGTYERRNLVGSLSSWLMDKSLQLRYTVSYEWYKTSRAKVTPKSELENILGRPCAFFFGPCSVRAPPMSAPREGPGASPRDALGPCWPIAHQAHPYGLAFVPGLPRLRFGP